MFSKNKNLYVCNSHTFNITLKSKYLTFFLSHFLRLVNTQIFVLSVGTWILYVPQVSFLKFGA